MMSKNRLKREPTARRFVFTLNNPVFTPKEYLQLAIFWTDIRYIIFQLEIAPITKTPHFQGYVEFNKQKTSSTLSHKHHMTMEIAHGTAEQNLIYCQKSESAIKNTFQTWGKPVTQGQRTDLIGFRDAISEGVTTIQLIEDYPIQVALYPKFMRLVRFSSFKRDIIPNKTVILCYGPPGTGKSEWAHNYKPNYWINPVATNKWFDGYEGQDTAIIDDYGGDGTVFKLVDLLRLLHKLTEIVPIKGAFVPWTPTTIIITTNYRPLLWYNLDPDEERRHIDRRISYKALTRRFTKVMIFEKNKQPTECKSYHEFFRNKYPTIKLQVYNKKQQLFSYERIDKAQLWKNKDLTTDERLITARKLYNRTREIQTLQKKNLLFADLDEEYKGEVQPYEQLMYQNQNTNTLHDEILTGIEDMQLDEAYASRTNCSPNSDEIPYEIHPDDIDILLSDDNLPPYLDSDDDGIMSIEPEEDAQIA